MIPAAFYTPLTQAEVELAQDLLYEISPMEPQQPRPVSDWTPIESMIFARWAVRVGIWEVNEIT